MLRRWMIALGFVVLSISAVGAQESAPPIVLVHGAFQDASGWDEVVAALEAQDQTVVTVELAGRGSDTTPLGEISLDTYRDQVLAVLEEQTAPVVLVGHSFGGLVISAAAEAAPEAVDTLVYLAAYLPTDGDSLVSLSSSDHFSQLGVEGNFIVAPDFSTGAVNPDIFASAFCPDCDPAQSETVAASQLDEPLAPLNTPLTLTDAAFGSVRKVYILTAEDIVVSPQLQAYMLSRQPVDHVYALNTGHAPYVTQPDAVAALIIAASAE